MARLFVESLAVNVRAADLLDVVLISALVYGIFAWLRHRVSRVVGFGIVTVAVLYAAAKVFDLYLTSMVFQVGLTGIVIALAIVFQDDIRRVFERLRTARLWEAGGPDDRRSELDTIIEAVDELADHNIGALIVLPGREALDVHLHGGVSAHAAVSVPLLMSLFHPHTDGHDGAVVIEGGQLKQFGVHLPLSTRLGKVGAGGTRHAAALGLAEHCDAFVIVVSEERATITVAHNGELQAVESSEQLRADIDRFEQIDQQPSAARRSVWPRWASHNVGLKFASIGVAMLLWALFAYRVETVQRTYEVPIEYRGLPTSRYLQDPKPIKARVELSGSERAFDEIDKSELKVSVNLAQRHQGPVEVNITDDQINEPTGVSVTNVDPGRLRLRVHQRIKMRLPVRPNLVGRLPGGATLGAVTADPSHVDVVGPAYLDGYVGRLATAPIHLDGIDTSQTIKSELVLPEHFRYPRADAPPVEVHVQVEPGRAGSEANAPAPGG